MTLDMIRSSVGHLGLLSMSLISLNLLLYMILFVDNRTSIEEDDGSDSDQEQ